MTRKINIIGCGNVGKTLGRLWAQHNVFEIGDITNQTQASSLKAIEFIGAGKATNSILEMNPADFFLITTPDDKISQTCKILSESGILLPENIVFQCSGSLPSTILKSAKEKGAYIGSVHPAMSFSEPTLCLEKFKGTYCALEGDQECSNDLSNIFEIIGGKIFSISSEHKTYYHAANVIVSNYLTALLELGIKTYIESGISEEQATKLMEPLVRGTIENVFRSGTTQALTGPIARGDTETVSIQLEALTSWNKLYGNLYKDMGVITLGLAKDKGTITQKSISALTKLLER